METIKDFLNFCNAAIFYDCKNTGITEELNQFRKCIVTSFHKTFPLSRILVILSRIEDIILKINVNDIENIIENINELRENILYMLSFEKLIRVEQLTIETNLNDNDENCPVYLKNLYYFSFLQRVKKSTLSVTDNKRCYIKETESKPWNHYL